MVEFETLPDFATKVPEAGVDVAVVPVMLLTKTALVALECIDESGAALATLTIDESAFVAWSVLVASAEADLGNRPSPSFVEALRAIAWGSRTQSNDELALFSSGASEHTDEWQRLSQGFFAKLASAPQP
jgi:hypothetical protein